MTSKELFAGVFSRHAAAYRSRVMSVVTRREARGRARVLELLDVRAGERVLDLGCGPGTLTLPLAEAVGPGGLVVGVDLAPGMLALAGAGAPPQLALARMDIERLALGDGAFAAAASGNSLQFCPDLARALAEARRVLRPGGRLAASVPTGSAGGHPADRLMQELFSRLLPPAPDIPDRRRTMAIIRDPAQLREATLAAGFGRAEVTQVEEPVSYSGPEEMVDRALSWWQCAWRLESVPAGERERIRAAAVGALGDELGDGPLEVPGASHVLYAAISSEA